MSQNIITMIVPPSLVKLILIHAICYVEINLEKTFISLSERAFEIILVSTFNKEMNRQFLIYLYLYLFFSIKLITPLITP